MDLDRFFAPHISEFDTFVDCLQYWTQQQPNEPAFWFVGSAEHDECLRYGELEQKVRAIAAQLVELGARGRRVLLLYPPGLDFVSAFFGCVFAGAVAVPAYPPRRNRKADRIRAIYRDAEAEYALTVQTVLKQVEDLGQGELTCVATDQTPLDMASAWSAPTLDRDSLAVLQYTSGSTGTPKGVMLTHANLLHNTGSIVYGFEPCRTGIGMTWLPTFHDMGLVGGVLKPIFYGRTNVLMSPMAFLQSPIRWLRAISRYRVTISGGPNFAYATCVDKITDAECDGLDLSSWDVAFNGAEPIYPDTLETFTEKFAPYGFRAETHYPCYGMAETTLIVTGAVKADKPVIRTFDKTELENRRAQEVAANTPGATRLVGCGRSMPGMQVVIVDEDSHDPLPENHIGEIWIAGPSVGLGYWNKPEETDRTFRARLKRNDHTDYLRTGDLGFLSDGELFVNGRCKDLLIVRGRNIFPQDIERTVERVHTVLRSDAGAAFSVPVQGEERLVVAQELERQGHREDLDKVIASIRATVLEAHEVAVDTVLLLKTGKLPKTSSGKVARNVCRQQFLADELSILKQWSLPRRVAPPVASSSPSEAALTTENAQSWLVSYVAKKLHITPSEVDLHQSFVHFGLDSAALVGISGELETWLGRTVSPTVLYSYPTIAMLAKHLGESVESPERAGSPERTESPVRPAADEPIAIVGIGCRFPRAADPHAFWRLLRNGVHAVRDMGSDRWAMDEYFSPDENAPGKMYCRHAGLLDQIDQFDASFFEIAPREAAEIDPQQRLLLEVAWETLEDAGHAPDLLADNRVGVYVGISNAEFDRARNRAAQFDAVDVHTGTGTLNSVAAGRLAYFLGLHGPCMVVDSACSSSLLAVHLAVRSLRNDECRAALAGGVNVILDPATMVAMCKLKALASDGRCKTFDQHADGYVRGEGCGMVLLKRLSEAVADGDRVLGLIRGSAANHDGRSNGLTAPHGPSQESVIRAALADAQVDPTLVSYLEAHGSATPLGDPIEIRSAAAVYASSRTSSTPLAIGSVKTNLGHLEAAAGIAGFLKVLLGLQHDEIPPHLHLEEPSEYIPWDELPITVPRTLTAWPAIRGRRLAGISSFGLSGTNVHLVVEGVDQVATRAPVPDRPCHALTLSARDKPALLALATAYRDSLQDEPDRLPDFCFTANTGRAALMHRAVIMATDTKQACRALDAIATEQGSPHVVSGVINDQKLPKVAFLFTGSGSPFTDMGRQLYETQPTFRTALEQCAGLLTDVWERPLIAQMYAQDTDPAAEQKVTYALPALFAVQYALCELWKSWGVRPDAVLGHGLGEYAAACAAGVLRLEDSVRLMVDYARLLETKCEDTTTLVVTAPETTVWEVLRERNGDAAISAVDGPNRTVITGRSETIRSVADRLKASGIATRRIPAVPAFHTPYLEPLMNDVEELWHGVSLKKPDRLFISGTDGQSVGDAVTSVDYWRRHARQTVRFVEGIRTLTSSGIDVCLEIGPNASLTETAQQTAQSEKQLWLASLRDGEDDWSQMLDSLARLFVRGVPVDWREFDKDFHRRKISIPTYPFQRRRHWADHALAQRKPDERSASRANQQATAKEMDECFYEVQWHPRSRLIQSVPRSDSDNLAPPNEVRTRVEPEVQRIRGQLNLVRYQQLAPELNRLAACYASKALKHLGWRIVPGQPITTTGMAEQLGIAEVHHRLLAQILVILEEDGLLVRTSDGWKVRRQLTPRPDPEIIWSELTRRLPECGAELNLSRQCGQHLAEVLSGEVDPLQILFPAGSGEMVERLYQDSPFARTLNTLVEEVIVNSIDILPTDRIIKILEIGAGTGSTTAQLLKRLPPDRTEYVFTDVSQIFMKTAAEKFRRYPFVRYELLDIEVDPQEQGYARNQFDMILAANVFHATRDLRETLCHTQKLLAPRGNLVLLEGTRPQYWLDLIFGLTEGWWRFVDTDLRPHHPMLSGPQWVDLLTESGFGQALAMPEPDGAPLDQQSPYAVIVAQGGGQAVRKERVERDQFSSPKPVSWLVLSDRCGVGSSLARLLRARGDTCVEIVRGESCERLEEDRWQVEPSSADDYRQVVALCDADPARPLRAVVHLWSLDAPQSDELTVDHLEQAQELGCQSTIALLRCLEDGSSRPHIWLATRGAQPVAQDGELSGLAQSPLWGLGRVFAAELPVSWGGLVDLDPHVCEEDAATQLFHEICEPDGEDQIGYRDGQRYAARLERRASPAKRAAARWRPDASYMITGGLGDLGLATARWLALQGATTLILFGRSAVPARADWDTVAASDDDWASRLAIIKELQEEGVFVKVASADVGDEAQLTRLVDEVHSEGLPPIRGVVHCAGVGEAGPLVEIEPQQLQRVLRPKVRGTWLLHKVLASERLDFFVTFSSGAAFLGSPLLGSYSAANTFLDAMAHFRAHQGQPALSVNWGFWDEMGMAARSQRELAQLFTPRGMQSFSPAQGLAAMGGLLADGAVQSTVTPLDWTQWCRSHPGASRSPLLTNMLHKETDLSDEAVDGSAPILTREEIFAASDSKRPELVRAYLQKQLARVLRTEAEEVDVELPLNFLGIDSLMAMELRNRIQMEIEVTIPVAHFLQKPTISQLAGVLLDQLQNADDVPALVPITQDQLVDDSAPDASAMLVLDQIDQLSDDEIKAMLTQMEKEQEQNR